MKRTSSHEPTPPRSHKRHNDRPFNITVGSTNNQGEEPLLGGKTKGAVYFRDQQKEKQSFGTFNYGNFPSYYSIRHKQGTAVIDHRIDLLDESIFNGKNILDIGCNSGNIAIALARKYKPAYIKGIDIDDGLIKKANINLRAVYSLGKPNSQEPPAHIDLSLRSHYFPQCMSNMFGLVPMAVPPNFEKTAFPWNVEFETMDWAQNPYDENEPKYDTLMALSITKWIQLHNGDKGLKSFFKKCYDSLSDGGTFVLEPIEIKFKKMSKKLDVDAKMEFNFLPEHYHDFLLNKLGFREVHDVGFPKGSKIPILLFIK